jgi:hypothetical protein
MSALTVLVIRHGEKPDPDHPDDPPGLTPDGKKDKHSPLIRGWQRAGAWAALFGGKMGGADFPQPTIVYAANPDQQGASHGKRTLETVLPPCDRLHITPITRFGVDDESDLVKEIEGLTGVVLISWEHKRIVEGILPELTKGQNLPHLPTKWHGTRFDVVLRLDRAQAGAQWSFRQLFPRLLAGDLNLPVSEKA